MRAAEIGSHLSTARLEGLIGQIPVVSQTTRFLRCRDLSRGVRVGYRSRRAFAHTGGRTMSSPRGHWPAKRLREIVTGKKAAPPNLAEFIRPRSTQES
jgi:hypothetical protein